MKYIRTKDGIIEVNPMLTNEQIDISQGKNTPRADTVGELCDEFCAIPFYDVCGIEAGKHYFVRKEEIEGFIPSVKIKTAELYGAIWTDKGLIYVAKMNESGELELI